MKPGSRRDLDCGWSTLSPWILSRSFYTRRDATQGPLEQTGASLLASCPDWFLRALELTLEKVVRGAAPPTWLSHILYVLLYKKGHPLSFDNYRPVGLLNAEYKVLSGITTGWIEQEAMTLGVIEEVQGAFQKGMDCLGMAFRMKMMARAAEISSQNTGQSYYIILLDVN